jgi:hypothetical protein
MLHITVKNYSVCFYHFSRARQSKAKVVKSKVMKSEVRAILRDKSVPDDFVSTDQYPLEDPDCLLTNFGQ